MLTILPLSLAFTLWKTPSSPASGSLPYIYDWFRSSLLLLPATFPVIRNTFSRYLSQTQTTIAQPHLSFSCRLLNDTRQTSDFTGITNTFFLLALDPRFVQLQVRCSFQFQDPTRSWTRLLPFNFFSAIRATPVFRSSQFPPVCPPSAGHFANSLADTMTDLHTHFGESNVSDLVAQLALSRQVNSRELASFLDQTPRFASTTHRRKENVIRLILALFSYSFCENSSH